jgi:hypothetical protein
MAKAAHEFNLFNEAARHCYEIIQKGRGKAVDQPGWAYETERWSGLRDRHSMRRSPNASEREGTPANSACESRRYRLVCKKRDATKTASVPPSLTPDTAPPKRKWRAIVFKPYLAKLYPPNGNVPDSVTTPQAYKDVTAAMKAGGKKTLIFPPPRPLPGS